MVGVTNVEKRELNAQSAGSDFATYNRAFMIPNGNGDWIFAIASRTRSKTSRGNVLLIPPYAVNSHEYFLFSYYLLANGFNVLRFDGINNVGFSSGTIEHYTLGQLEADLSLVVDTFFNTGEIFETDDLHLIMASQSLSFPVALKYSLRNDRVSRIISVVGVVNVKDTVERIMERSLDCYVTRLPGAPLHGRIFGHLTAAQRFVDDAIKNSYFRLSDMISCFQKLRRPVYMVSSKTDEYVQFDDVIKCKDYIEVMGRLVVVDDVSHMIGRSLFTAKSLAKLTVEFAAANSVEDHTLEFPRLTDAVRFASMEADFINQCERHIFAK
jgi:hypothetical protein